MSSGPGVKVCKAAGSLTGAEEATFADGPGASTVTPGGAIPTFYNVKPKGFNISVYSSDGKNPSSVLVTGKKSYSGAGGDGIKADGNGATVDVDVAGFGATGAAPKIHVKVTFTCG